MHDYPDTLCDCMFCEADFDFELEVAMDMEKLDKFDVLEEECIEWE